ncbi:phosphotransferase enzyme family protein [Kribbella sp. NPDC051587]|uniref:phosphotransferase enzyme family protein n=1 Tax=Kribbella sp. NPDC051587 TaxID=3364119 RepID=UPI0037A4BE18
MVDERAIALAALESFPVEVRRVTRAAQSFNTIYRVETPSATYALRVGPALQIHAAGTAAAEADWQRALVADGFAVPDVVLTREGEPVVTVEGRTCVLFTWIHGRSMRTRLGPSRARTLGQLMARLHDHPARRDVDVLHADKVLYWLLPDRLADVPEHGKVLTEARDSVQALIDELWTGREPQLIHGDLTAANVIEAPGPVPIDFQDLVIGFPEQDISFTLASFGRRDDREAMAEAFRAGYSEVRAWPEMSETTLRGLIVARGLHQLNLSLATAEGPLPQDYLDYHGARAQAWLDS